MIKCRWFIFFYLSLFGTLLTYFSSPAQAAIIAGNPQGSITLVDFFDYQCPHCQRMAIILQQLINQNASVRVVYKVAPVLNPSSWLSARAVLAARYQKQALMFHYLLLTSGLINNEEQLYYLAEKAGLNPSLLIKDMYQPAINAELQHNLADLQALQAAGVPMLLIGYTNANKPAFIFNGEISLEALQQTLHQLQ